MSDFKSCFKELIFQRTEDIWTKTSQQNKQVMRIDRNLGRLQEALLNGLTEEQKKIFLKYEDEVNLQISYLRQVLYNVGFKDGIAVAMESDEGVMLEVFKQ